MTILSLRPAAQRRGYPLIAAHRGTPGGIVPPNTVAAARAAIASGADIVELDVARSSDGEYFAFHDTYESRLVATSERLTHMKAEQIHCLRYWEHEGRDCGGVELFADVVAGLPDVTINVDRSYRYWGDGFLDELATWGDPRRLLVKCLADDRQLDAFASCGEPFPFMGVAHCDSDIDRYLELGDERLVGIEIVTADADDPMLSSARIGSLHDAGLGVWLNAINLENGKPLAAGADDSVSLAGDANAGWGQLARWGADVVQTDWPWLVRQYYTQKTAPGA